MSFGRIVLLVALLSLGMYALSLVGYHVNPAVADAIMIGAVALDAVVSVAPQSQQSDAAIA